MTNIHNQRGVALLFALGVLSLMLIMGIAFLGNSLITQKIAANNQESSSAKMVGHDALNRVLAHLMLFNQVVAKSANHHGVDAESVYSRSATDSTVDTKNDLLASKLSVDPQTVSGTPPTVVPLFNGNNSVAHWIYVHANGRESNGSGEASVTDENASKIIARYAYQVLPQTSKSRIPLFAVTSGVTRIAGSGTPGTDSRIPHKHRWGMDVDELVIPDLQHTAADEWTKLFYKCWGKAPVAETDLAYSPQHEFDNFINLLSGSKEGEPKVFSGASTPDKENLKRWLRHIFVEGKARMAREAYLADDGATKKWYPRFNLGEFSKYYDDTNKVYKNIQDKDTLGSWYQRFIAAPEEGKEKDAVGALQNSSSVLDLLTKKSGDEYKADYLYDHEYTSFGLPFLRRIGNAGELGAFDTVANLRKQIAANLNDYCDKDSIPTSDQPAESWVDGSGNVIATAPSYTGNEKTLYINEIAFGFMLSGAEFVPESASVYNYQANLSAEIIAELIRVYKEVENIKTAKLYGKINSLGVTFKVSLTGKISGSYTDETGNPKDFVDLPFDTVSVASVPVEIKDKTFIIDFSDEKVVANAASNYWLKNYEFVKESDAQKVKVNLYPKLKEAVQSQTGDKDISNINIKLEGIKVEIDKMTFNLGNMALTMKVKKNGADITSGVDFVKFKTPLAASDYFCVKPSAFSEKTAESGGTLALNGVKSILHTGVMQAIDPRQNLIADFERDGDNESKNIRASDWYLSGTHEMTEITPDSTWVWGTFSSRFSSGKVNKCSKPNKNYYADDIYLQRTDCDTEQAEDPAWKGDEHGNHISTAVIRNAPMRSPWELGFIHRGIPFQTINLKKAGGVGNNLSVSNNDKLDDKAHSADFSTWENADGTRYVHGDAGILDQIKMTEYNKSYGKVNLEVIKGAQPSWWLNGGTLAFSAMNGALFKSLFEGIRAQTAIDFLTESADALKGPATVNGVEINDRGGSVDWSTVTMTSPHRSLIVNDTGLDAVFTTLANTDVKANHDAAKEEVIGKTINLLDMGKQDFTCLPPDTYRVIIVAQTIRDLSGDIGILNHENTLVMAKSAGGLGATKEAKDGRFDANITQNLYFDEILSECRMLVTVEKVNYFAADGTPRARLRVKQIEYLD